MLQEVMVWIPIEMGLVSSNRVIELHQIQRRRGGRHRGVWGQGGRTKRGSSSAQVHLLVLKTIGKHLYGHFPLGLDQEGTMFSLFGR